MTEALKPLLLLLNRYQSCRPYLGIVFLLKKNQVSKPPKGDGHSQTHRDCEI